MITPILWYVNQVCSNAHTERRINWYHRDQDLKLAEQRRQIKGNNKQETEKPNGKNGGKVIGPHNFPSLLPNTKQI